VSAVAVLAGRALRLGARNPGVLVQTLIFPLLLLAVFMIAFEDVMPTPGGIDYAQRLVPLLVLTGASFGGMALAGAVLRERDEGVADRLRALPLPPGTVLAGRVVGETLRVVLSGVVLTAAGYVVGFRFSAGIAGALGYWLLLSLVAGTFALLFVAVGMRVRAVETILLTNPLLLVLMFLSPGFVPLEAFPTWLQDVVEVNPYTSIIDAALGLTSSGAVTGPLLRSVAWCLAASAVAAVIAVRAERAR